jgi:hypothetical protein
MGAGTLTVFPSHSFGLEQLIAKIRNQRRTRVERNREQAIGGALEEAR